MNVVSEDGYGIFTVAPTVWSVLGKRYREFLEEMKIYTQAVIYPPEGILRPMTSIRPIMLVLNKKKPDALFVGEILDIDGMGDILDNFFNNKGTQYLEQGYLIDENRFKGIDNLKFKWEFEKLQSGYKSYQQYPLVEVSKEINSGRPDKEFKSKDNAIYFPRVGESKVHYDLSKITMKKHNYFQIILNKSIITNKYAALFYASGLGKAIRKTLISGATIPHISKRSLIDSAVIAIPTLEEQVKIVAMHDKIELLSKILNSISNELSLNPQNIKLLSKQADHLIEELSILSLSDKIKSGIRKGENKEREFKQTLSLDINTNQKAKYLEKSVLKTVAAFLNTDGGILYIGVADDSSIVGVDLEIAKLYKGSKDSYLKHFKDILKQSIGEDFYPLIDDDLVEVDDKTILIVECKQSTYPCYINDKDFFVRTNPATDRLEGRKALEYIKRHFDISH